ncbi:MAG: hypothetical protein ACRC9Q_03135 [Bacteroidales bacterium]
MKNESVSNNKAATPMKVDLDKVIELVSKDWTLGELHGIYHWKCVERNGALLQQGGVNPCVVRLFAYFHDSCRIDDCCDIEHGPRAAQFVESLRNSLLRELTDEEFMQLKTACELHTTAHRVGDITIDTCFDADRLDLERCGIVPDPDLMATPTGKYYASNLELFYSLTNNRR